jgi:hypothetical protein
LDSKKEHQAELDRAEYRLEDLRKKLDELKKKKMDENYILLKKQKIKTKTNIIMILCLS